MALRRAAIASVFVALAGGCVHVKDRKEDRVGFYYDRPGATVAQARADKAGCRTSPDGRSDLVFTRAPELEAFAEGLTQHAQTECMAAKGYERILVKGPALDALAAMNRSERDRALQALMNANDPTSGTVEKR